MTDSQPGLEIRHLLKTNSYNLRQRRVKTLWLKSVLLKGCLQQPAPTAGYRMSVYRTVCREFCLALVTHIFWRDTQDFAWSGSTSKAVFYFIFYGGTIEWMSVPAVAKRPSTTKRLPLFNRALWNYRVCLQSAKRQWLLAYVFMEPKNK